MRSKLARNVGAAILVLFALVAANKPARAEVWCVRHFGDSTPRACVFWSAQDCLRMVIIGTGGICERQPIQDTKKTRPGAKDRNRFPDPPRLTAW